MRSRKLIAIAACVWVLFTGVAAGALGALTLAHDHEHAADVADPHDADSHAHADTLVEVISQLGDESGLVKLGASPLPSHLAPFKFPPNVHAKAPEPDTSMPSALFAPSGPPPKGSPLFDIA
jgi:hypothetical protein